MLYVGVVQNHGVSLSLTKIAFCTLGALCRVLQEGKALLDFPDVGKALSTSGLYFEIYDIRRTFEHEIHSNSSIDNIIKKKERYFKYKTPIATSSYLFREKKNSICTLWKKCICRCAFCFTNKINIRKNEIPELIN